MSTKKKKALPQNSNPVGYGRPPVHSRFRKGHPAILLENGGMASNASLSLATPISPVPASPETAAWVIGLRSGGASLPLNAPPRSIARCAAAA